MRYDDTYNITLHTPAVYQCENAALALAALKLLWENLRYPGDFERSSPAVSARPGGRGVWKNWRRIFMWMALTMWTGLKPLLRRCAGLCRATDISGFRCGRRQRL